MLVGPGALNTNDVLTVRGSAANVQLSVENTDTNGSALIYTQIALGTGNAQFSTIVNNVSTWIWGNNQSAANDFQISRGGVLGTNNAITINTDGYVTLSDRVIVGNGPLGNNDSLTVTDSKSGAPPEYVQMSAQNSSATGSSLIYASSINNAACFGSSVGGGINWMWGSSGPTGPFIISTGNTFGTPNRFQVATTGAATFNSAFTFPVADGTASQVLTTNGGGVVSWATHAATAGAANAYCVFTIPGSAGSVTPGNQFNVASISYTTTPSISAIITLTSGAISGVSTTANTVVVTQPGSLDVSVSGLVITLSGFGPAPIISVTVYQS